MSYAYPGSVHVTPDEALSIPHGARGCQATGVGATRRSWCFWARGVMPGDRVIIKFKKEGEVLVAEEVRKLR